MTTFNGTPVSTPTASTSVTAAISRPIRYRRPRLLTMADAVDRVLRCDEINPGETRSVERAVLAVRSAVGSFASYSTQGFKYYDARARLVLEATDSIGEITVSNGTVTPTVATTWPSWIDYSALRVSNKSYPVLSHTGTTLQVDTLPNGTYTTSSLEQIFVRLPQNFRRRGSLTDNTNSYPIDDVSSGRLQSWADYRDWARSSSQRGFAAASMDERFQGELMLAVWPPYPTRKELNMFYERYPAPCETHRFGSGTVTVVGTTATASASVFTEDHVGSALVISTSSNAEIRSSLSSLDIVVGQRVITDYTSGTVVTLDAGFSSDVLESFTTRAFYISDIVDVMPGPMMEAFLRLCEHELARQSKSKSTSRRFAEFRAQLELSMADDVRYKDSADDGYRGYGLGYGVGEVDGTP